LRLLRELTREHGALLIFDEVISGLRVAPGGMAQRLGLEPDIATLGKILGGGMPVGAYLANAELMRHVAPLGPVYQAGTLSGNPVAMAAGLATLRELDGPDVYARLDALGSSLQDAFSAVLAAREVPAAVARVGSILWLCLQAEPLPRAWSQVDKGCAGRYAKLHRALLERGVWLAPSPYEVAFVSLAHTQEHIERAAAALDAALAAEQGAD
jgi:glutamate-1-semialdehyde 2,1-aminomutase